MKKTLSISQSLITVSSQSVNVKAVKGDKKPVLNTVLGTVHHLREVSKELRQGNPQLCIALINSDAMRPIRLIESILNRSLTEEEKYAYNECAEHCPEHLKRVISVAKRFQDTNQTLRKLIRENIVKGHIPQDTANRINRELEEFTEQLELFIK